MSTQYYFLPSVRQGLAAAIVQPAGSNSRSEIDVVVRVTGDVAGGQGQDTVDIERTVSLLGPGDILGFDPRVVTRTVPEEDVGNFEPNYFPAVEFADHDFAWRFTAAPADPQTGALMPWITLIVLISETRGTDILQEFDDGQWEGKTLPRHIEIRDLASLPDLAHVPAWAHVQVAAEPGLVQSQVRAILSQEPERAVCRLLCPRRLRPGVGYSAFVVPTFKLGLLAGLGLPLDSTGALIPAWDVGAGSAALEPGLTADSGAFKLPYYYRWNFRTGMRGDFEHLVRELEPRPLSKLGLRDIDCSGPGYHLRGVYRSNVERDERPETLGLEGALRSIDTTYTAWGQDPVDPQITRPRPGTNFQVELAGLLNLADDHIEGQANDSLGIAGTAPNASSPQTGDGTATSPDLPVVVPPLYGRWHRGETRVDADNQASWFEVLNLDPRHRSAAGLGAQVVSKQQESLMASAWEQLGAIESANDVLRRAQFGRDNSRNLYHLLQEILSESLLQITAPVHSRIRMELAVDGDDSLPRTVTVAHFIRTESRAWEATLDPAFRRLSRRRGPIRNRQPERQSTDLISRLANGTLTAAGPPPTPQGTMRLCNITQLLDDEFLQTDDDGAAGGTGSGPADPAGGGVNTGTSGSEATSSDLDGSLVEPGDGPSTDLPTDIPDTIPPEEEPPEATPRFCDGDGISCQEINDAFNSTPGPFAGITDPANPSGLEQVVCDTINNWLDETEPPDETPSLPRLDLQIFLDAIVIPALDPEHTILERVQRRLRLGATLAERFGPGQVGDPLDPLTWAPEFPKPMYEPLRDLSHNLLLPGVEKIRQNTVGLLLTNRRFTEAYMCGLNDAMAGEFLWRGFPTDQRGSYFRQFWDVSDYIPEPSELNTLRQEWLSDRNLTSVAAIPQIEKERILALHPHGGNFRHTDDLKEIARAHFLELFPDVFPDIHSLSTGQFDQLVEEVLKANLLQEKLKDIRPLVTWGENALGKNDNDSSDLVVLVIRGDLLKRYPNALIYAVPAVNADCDQGDIVPALPEFMSCSDDNTRDQYLQDKRPSFPVFRADLPPDLTFFGFPFTAEEARQSPTTPGMFFIIEERPGEARFGLDVDGQTLNNWADLAWSHFSLAGGYGTYIDAAALGASGTFPADWASATSAGRAAYTFQQPVRIAIHADQFIPEPDDSVAP